MSIADTNRIAALEEQIAKLEATVRALQLRLEALEAQPVKGGKRG